MDFTILKDMIDKRLSVRRYEKRALDEITRAEILSAVSDVKPLYSDIKTAFRYFRRDEVRSLMPWMPEDAIGIYSEVKDGYLENAGFMLAEADLYLQSRGIGACWVGLAGPKDKEPVDGMEFVILLAIGKTNVKARNGASDFKRKAISEITSSEELYGALEPARLAPSSVNSQPWYFVKCGDEIDVYQLDLVRTKGLRRMNRIDVGIALAHLFVSRPDGFFAYVKNDAPERGGMTYITTVKYFG